MAVISKGITLSYKVGTSGTTYTQLTNLQEIPELGGDTEAIEITTLADAAHIYTDGIKNYGDALAFKFLYDTTQFETLAALNTEPEWKVTLPDGATCTFDGSCSVKLDGVGVNAALTYTLSIRPSSEMTWA
jgi:hypothetical protein